MSLIGVRCGTQGLKNKHKVMAGLDSATIPVARDDLDSVTCSEKISLRIQANQLGMDFYTPKARILKQCLLENSSTRPLSNLATGMIGVITSKDTDKVGTYDELSRVNAILTNITPLPRGSLNSLQKKIIPLATLFGESFWTISEVLELHKNIAPIEVLHLDLVNTLNSPASKLVSSIISSQMNLVGSLELRKE